MCKNYSPQRLIYSCKIECSRGLNIIEILYDEKRVADTSHTEKTMFPFPFKLNEI